MQKYESMWDGHLERIMVAKHKTDLNSPDAPPLHLASYRSGLNQQELEHGKAAWTEKTVTTELAVTRSGSHIGLVLKKDRGLCVFVDYHRQNFVTILDGYFIPRMDKCIDS